MHPGVRQPAVVRIGTVRRAAYYALEPSPAASDYVAYLAFLRDGKEGVGRLVRELSRVAAARANADARLIPLPQELLAARAVRLMIETTGIAAWLDAAATVAPLTVAEQSEAARVVAALKLISMRCQRAAEGLRRDPTDHVPDAAVLVVLPPSMRISVPEAYRAVEGLATHVMRSPAQLSAHFARPVRVMRPLRASGSSKTDLATRAGAGRPSVNALDRPAFAAYALGRWVGPRWGAFVAQGVHALGSLREAGPCALALGRGHCLSAHVALCAALALLDDGPSRSALTEYLKGAAEDARRYPAAHAAAFGLARKPIGGLASILAPDERIALTITAENSPNALARAIAARVLESWTDDWNRDRLLGL